MSSPLPGGGAAPKVVGRWVVSVTHCTALSLWALPGALSRSLSLRASV